MKPIRSLVNEFQSVTTLGKRLLFILIFTKDILYSVLNNNYKSLLQELIPGLL